MSPAEFVRKVVGMIFNGIQLTERRKRMSGNIFRTVVHVRELWNQKRWRMNVISDACPARHSASRGLQKIDIRELMLNKYSLN
jgi:hypothetical protein